MDKRTGEIRHHEDIPKEELGHWSEPFKIGDEIDFKGVNMKIIKIKKLKKQIVLEFKGR